MGTENGLNKRILPPYAKWFSGKTALITGATSGIGREIAKQLALYGSRVLVCGRDKSAMDSLLKELNLISSDHPEGFTPLENLTPRSSQDEHNYNLVLEKVVELKISPFLTGFISDLSDKNSQKELIEKINKNYEVDILVNNAGFGYMNDFHLMPEDLINSMVEVNMAAVVDFCRAFLPKMIKKFQGGILNVGSVASFFATPGSALYGATKHFVLGFTDALHQEMLSFGVHITGVYPGHTHSRFISRATSGKTKNWHKAMSPVLVAKLALKGLSENKIRVIPGLGNKMRVLAASIIPISMILKKIYAKAVKNYKPR